MGLLTILCSFACPASGQTATAEKDSLRFEIQRAIDTAHALLDERSSHSVKSARIFLDSTLTMIQQNIGLTDTLTAEVYNNLSRYYIIESKFDDAIKSAHMALDILQKAPGGSPFQAQLSYGYLVETCLKLHDLVNCEHYCDRRFEILNSLNKPLSILEAEQMADALNDRGRLLVLQNQFDNAIEDFELGLTFATDKTKSGARLQVDLNGNIAWILSQQGKFAESEKRLTKVLEMAKRAYNPKHPLILMTLNLLWKAAFYTGHYDRADSLINAEIALNKELFGNAFDSDILQDLSYQRLAQDRPEEAIKAAKQAVEQNRITTGDYPTNKLMGSLENAGNVAMATDRWELAREMFDTLLSYRQTFLHTVFGYASETQKLNYIAKYSPIIHTLLSGVAMPSSTPLRETALNMVLRGKGMGVDAMAEEYAAAICSVDPYLDSLIGEHRAVCSEIAGIFGTSSGSDDNTLQRLNQLYGKKDNLEKELSSGCSHLQMGRDADAITAEAVTMRIPNRSALLEIIKFARLDITKLYEGRGPKELAYLAMVLTPDTAVSIVDLGDAAIIDSLIIEYHAVMSDALHEHYMAENSQLYERYLNLSGKLYDRLIRPLHGSLSDVDKIYIAPDGMLNLMPFETLTENGNRFLVEDYECIYLTSGRDLLRDKSKAVSRDAIVIADPDYMIDPTMLPAIAGIESSSMFAVRGNTATPECLGSMFSPLPMTRIEGTAITSLLNSTKRYDITYLESDQAREGILKSLKHPPGLLHIATHGYFCEQVENPYLSNPLLRSGLILAGANRTIGKMNLGTANGEDGILTAMEVSGLNLIGTDLLVLSACQTGIGDVQNGEGVFGLRRAFQHAGAKSVVMSMFAVPDESTSELMKRFYENWLSGQSKSAALRSASLSILDEHRANGQSTHPLFWGGFILVGDPE